MCDRALQAGLLEEVVIKRDHLRINLRPGRTDGLHAELVMLAIAAGLRTFIAEDGGDVEELLRPALGAEAVLDIRAHRRGPCLPARSVKLRPPRSSKVYICLWTISVPSPTPYVKSSVSSNRGVRISAVPESARDLAEGGFQRLPTPGVLGQNILRPPGGFELRGHAKTFARKLAAARNARRSNGSAGTDRTKAEVSVLRREPQCRSP